MQAYSYHQNPVISRLLISFLAAITIILICLLAHQVYVMICHILPMISRELSNVAAQTLYIR